MEGPDIRQTPGGNGSYIRQMPGRNGPDIRHKLLMCKIFDGIRREVLLDIRYNPAQTMENELDIRYKQAENDLDFGTNKGRMN